MTYPLGWSVIPHMLIRRERWPGGYKTRGSALVYPGQEVQPDQPVFRLEMPEGAQSVREFPGSIAPTSPPASQLAGFHAAQKYMHANVQQMNGMVVSGMRGRVVDITRRGGVIIETRAAIIQGTIGAGNQVAGILTFWNSSSPFQPSSAVLANTSKVTTLSLPIAAPTILVVPGPLNFAMLRQAMNMGVAGIVASSISSRDLEGFLGTCVIPYGDLPQGQVALRVGIEYSNGRQVTAEVMSGSIEIIPLRINEQAMLTLYPAPTVDVGLGSGERARAAEEIDGGLVGLVIDARGRPLVFPTDETERHARLVQWMQVFGV